ncbi:hypothetical protein [Mycobacterium sp. AT1]|nr:hypothetical protein [Mycobacterium sp. AT1]
MSPPASYRMLAYYFDIRGYPVDPDLPGDDQPAMAEALRTEAFHWLED